MHGNAGNKTEGAEYAPMFLPMGVDFFCFDFSGCGNSEGEWVTLGWKEKLDLLGVLDWLKEQGRTSKVGLWGRSMGAATTLMLDATESSLPIGAIALDSVFAEFKQIAGDMGGQFGLGPDMIQMLLPMLTEQVKQKTGGCDLNELTPHTFSPNWKETPALFLHGQNDNFIVPNHSQRCFDAYGCA